MGYRSNLVVLIYPDAEKVEDYQPLYDQLKVLMGTTFKHITDEFGDPYMTWLDEDHVLKFVINDVKWYPSYPDVQRFESMLNAFSSEEITGYCTEFIRTGEEADDIEERSSGESRQYYLSVRVDIECNV